MDLTSAVVDQRTSVRLPQDAQNGR